MSRCGGGKGEQNVILRKIRALLAGLLVTKME
jgi:hypothetical protein